MLVKNQENIPVKQRKYVLQKRILLYLNRNYVAEGNNETNMRQNFLIQIRNKELMYQN